MSGSFDRPPGPPYPPTGTVRSRAPGVTYTSPRTGPAAPAPPAPHAPHIPHAPGPPYPAQPAPPPAAPPHYEPDPYSMPHSRPEPPRDHELRADVQPSSAPSKEPANAPVIPARTVTGRSLTLVISIMCFLACLTAGAVYMINQSASAWLRDVAGEVTVQIEPREGVDTEKVVGEVTAFLRQQTGIRGVKPMSEQQSIALIEPWLGKSDALASLPVPRLIAIEIDQAAPPDFDTLGRTLKGRFKGAALDDHRHWQRQIRTVTRSLALGGLAILMLVGAATTAIIISATGSAMASNREIVEVLHFVGATDRFIAREFEKHFLRLGIRAGIVGAVSAMLVFLLLPRGMEILGGAAASMADLRWMIGAGALDLPGYLVLVVVVVVISALCMLTSRIGVYRILNGQH